MIFHTYHIILYEIFQQIKKTGFNTQKPVAVNLCPYSRATSTNRYRYQISSPYRHLLSSSKPGKHSYLKDCIPRFNASQKTFSRILG
jgi:hypothetical protein